MGCYEVMYYIFGIAQIWMKGYILDMGCKSVLSKPRRNKKIARLFYFKFFDFFNPNNADFFESILFKKN